MMKTNFRSIWSFLKQIFDEWIDDRAPQLGAALAFYSALSLGPLLILALAIAGLVFGDDAAQGKIIDQLQGLIGEPGAVVINDMIESSAKQKETGIVAAVIGVTVLLIGASGVFGQLQTALDTIWNVQPKKHAGLSGYLRRRFFSFAMVMGTGFLLLISLLISATLSAVGEYASGHFENFVAVMDIVNIVISFAVVTLLFAVIFKYVPDAKIAWRDVWIGAVLTACLFTIGKTGIGLYLGQGSFSSTYGAAGSLVAVLVWVYYSAQILFLGAEFTQVYARWRGARIVPEAHAEFVTLDGAKTA